MKRFSDVFGTIILLFTYLAGLVLANGFWQTTAALFPLYAWYLTVEKILHIIGWI